MQILRYSWFLLPYKNQNMFINKIIWNPFYLNCCSVKTKAFSLADLLTSHNIDILALTATFLGACLNWTILADILQVTWLDKCGSNIRSRCQAYSFYHGKGIWWILENLKMDSVIYFLWWVLNLPEQLATLPQKIIWWPLWCWCLSVHRTCATHDWNNLGAWLFVRCDYYTWF